jgi:hypothetical protein
VEREGTRESGGNGAMKPGGCALPFIGVGRRQRAVMARVMSLTPLMAGVGLRWDLDGLGELRHEGGISRW